MKLNCLLDGIDILQTDIKDFDIEISGISDDSYSVGENEIFVALKGRCHDGHRFISQAIDRGACVIICEKKPREIKAGYIKVKNSRAAYAVLWNNFCSRPADKIKLIGVTGTNGKTTTVKLIEHILESVGRRVKSIGTLNAPLTTPDPPTLYPRLAEMAESGVEYAVMEVSSHSLYYDKLYPLKFEIGIFTNLTNEHLDFHESMYAYAKAKAKLFGRSLLCIYNADDKFAQSICGDCEKRISFSIINSESDYCATDIKLNFENISYNLLGKGRIDRVTLPIVGRFNVYNSMAAVVAAMHLGIGIEEIGKALSNVEKIDGRLDRVATVNNREIFIDYAHTPDAISKVLSTLRECANENQKIVAIFGCGGDRDKSKRPMMGKIATELADYCIITSDNPRNEDPYSIIKDIVSGIEKNNYLIIADRRSAIEYSIRSSKDGDILVFLGKGHEKYEINMTGKIPFDERAIIKNTLE